MGNPQRGEVTINVADKDRTIHFTLGALAELQERFGIESIEALPEIIFADIGKVTETFWVGLRTSDPDLTLETVRDKWIVPVTEVVRVVSRAFMLAYIGSDDLKNVEPPGTKTTSPAKSGRGKKQAG